MHLAQVNLDTCSAAQIVFSLVRVSWVSSFCCWAAGWLLLASSARDATAKHWACHAISIGHALSAISSHLMAPSHASDGDGKCGPHSTLNPKPHWVPSCAF